jgi:hypothetical protein
VHLCRRWYTPLFFHLPAPAPSIGSFQVGTTRAHANQVGSTLLQSHGEGGSCSAASTSTAIASESVLVPSLARFGLRSSAASAARLLAQRSISIISHRLARGPGNSLRARNKGLITQPLAVTFGHHSRLNIHRLNNSYRESLQQISRV